LIDFHFYGIITYLDRQLSKNKYVLYRCPN